MEQELYSMCLAEWHKCLAQREELVKAFVAKYGGEPQDFEQVMEKTYTTRGETITFYIRRKQDGRST